MSLLTDDEEWKLWNAQGIDDMNQAEAIAFARAYAAAILAKLAGAELPEPAMKNFTLGPMFTTEQMNARFAQGAAAQLAHEPEWYAYRTNGAHWFCFQDKPPEDAYDEGTLKPLYTRREA